MSDPAGQDDFLTAIGRRLARLKRAREEGEPTFAGQLSQVGVLGWIVVFPIAIGILVGTWLDEHLGSGVFWTAALIMIGAALGFWFAWRWMRAP
ncbi:MAG: ATPase F0F1 [Alphaproteobacteria bacterium]|nr:ATPase F0F1 [Alphaproteobacteria bacterium]